MQDKEETKTGCFLPEQQAGLAYAWVTDQQQLEEVVTEGRFSLASHLNTWVSKAIKREAKKDFETWTIELPPPRRSADSHSLTKRISSQRYSLFWVHGGHRTSLDSETEPFSVKMKHQRKWISPQDQTAEFLRWGDKYAAVAAAAHCAGVQSSEPPATRQAEM